jgi:hypothetical protein
MGKKSPLLLALTALAFGWITEAQAQALSEDDLIRCQELLDQLDPGVQPNEEQARCLALLAELGVQPAVGQFDSWNDNNPNVNPSFGPPS